MNVIYIGLDNPANISVPGYPPDQLLLTTKGGCTIRKTDSSYFFDAQTRGECKLTIATKMAKLRKRKTLG